MQNSTSPREEKDTANTVTSDYTPKEYTFKEQLVFGAKIAAGAALFFLFIWFYES